MKVEKQEKGFRNDKGMVLVIGVMMLSLMTLFGSVMMSRMILDADTSVRKLISTRTYYMTDAGIEWGRKYLENNNSNVTLGPVTIGGGTLTVTVQRTSIKLTTYNNSQNVYRIESSANYAGTERTVEEYRYRGGGNDKEFLLYRDVVANEF